MKNHSDYLNRPIFISGYHKSGTTLLLSILDGHPELVVVPEELFFFKSVLFAKDKAKAIREQSGFKMFLSDQEQPEWSSWRTFFKEGYPEFDHERFNQQFEQAVQDSRNFKDLMLRMVSAFAEVDQVDPAARSHWASKTPLEETYFPLMLKMFGKEGKFIYVVRDPRDVYISVSKWKSNRGKPSDQDINSMMRFSIYWQTRLHQAVSYQKKYENVCILRYEDLLLNTEHSLRQLCNFLEIEYSPELLQPTRHGKQWGGNSAHGQEYKGLSSDPVGRYQKILDPKAQAVLENLLHEDMATFGYLDGDSAPAAPADEIPIPWRDYRFALKKYQLRYFLNQAYIRIRFNFPQLQ